MILEELGKTKDIHSLTQEEYRQLAAQIRSILIHTVSRNGGHLASNLGTVELTIALHAAFHLPEDKIIWDVGHQAYTHKILSGRREEFSTLRQFGGVSGFPKRAESPYDVFDTGHSTTSISAGLGMAQARELLGEHYKVVSVIGDGSLTGGMAYEALNNAARLKSNFIIVLNDNNMSISENVGGMSKYLTAIRTSEGYTGMKQRVTGAVKDLPVFGEDIYQTISRTKSGIKHWMIPGMFFEDLGVTYLGPYRGHDIPALIEAFKEASRVKGPVVVHVKTVKGKGYGPAETAPSVFHGIGPFDVRTGRPLGEGGPSYTKVFSQVITEMAEENPELVALTAAMPDGTGLSEFAEKYPKRFFDTGIAEQHMVTSAAGMAAAGLRPVVCVYSSFLQRAYDQVLEDVCLQKLPVVFCIDRAGIVGADGETHQGLFDLSYLSQMPGMTVIAPAGARELRQAVRYAYALGQPAAVRYPRGRAFEETWDTEEYSQGKSQTIRDGKDVVILAEGPFVQSALETSDLLKGSGIEAAVVNMRFIKPVDTELLEKIRAKYSLVVTMEDNIRTGGLGEKVAEYYACMAEKPRVLIEAFPDEFIPHGTREELLEANGLSAGQMAEQILAEL